ncbi:MAG: hypothetical protein Q8S27_15715, partial [Hoeflea sp.]|nr:hypothetical protein [Hoeflea sp.]
LNIFKSVYRSEDAAHYASKAGIKAVSHAKDGTARSDDKAMDYFRKYYRKHQLSDHNLLWCEIKTDFSGHYLDAVAAGQTPGRM